MFNPGLERLHRESCPVIVTSCPIPGLRSDTCVFKDNLAGNADSDPSAYDLPCFGIGGNQSHSESVPEGRAGGVSPLSSRAVAHRTGD